MLRGARLRNPGVYPRQVIAPHDDVADQHVALFLRGFRDRILDEWECSMRRAWTRDHAPALLDAMIEAAEARAAGRPAAPPIGRAIDALACAVELAEIVRELGLLRVVALRRWFEDGPRDASPREAFLRLALLVDEVMDTVIVRAARARSRLTRELEALAAASASGSPPELPARVAGLVLRRVRVADAAEVYVCEPWGADRVAVRVRARRIAPPPRVEMVLRVASSRTPLLVARDASAAGGDGCVRYAVPLARGREVVGVLAVTSRTLPDFGADVQHLLQTIGRRLARGLPRALSDPGMRVPAGA